MSVTGTGFLLALVPWDYKAFCCCAIQRAKVSVLIMIYVSKIPVTVAKLLPMSQSFKTFSIAKF
jgi:hypothetical protein